ncbi:MAG: response regulator transcription factor [Reichenbachiella sp.]
MPNEKLKIVLIDDHKMIREGIKSFLVENDSYEIVGEAADGIEGLQLIEEVSPDLVLTDILMPNMNGIEMTEKLFEEERNVKVVALTMLNENQHIKQMMKAGASGYLLKNCTEDELNEAITEVVAGNTYYGDDVKDTILNMVASKPSAKTRVSYEIPLTDRELEILHLICKEYTNKEISDELFIGMRTVDAHKRNLLEKTGCKNVAGLVVYSIERNLFTDL